jgi:hypothetical protein
LELIRHVYFILFYFLFYFILYLFRVDVERIINHTIIATSPNEKRYYWASKDNNLFIEKYGLGDWKKEERKTAIFELGLIKPETFFIEKNFFN